METSVPAVAGYDYIKIAPEHRDELREIAQEVRLEIRKLLAAKMRIGERLWRARHLLPHGEWTPWLLDASKMSEQGARDCMGLFERFSSEPELLRDLSMSLGVTSIIRLAKAPDQAVSNVSSRVRDGENLRVEDVVQVIRSYRPETSATSSGQVVTLTFADGYDAEDALRSMGNRAQDELVPKIIEGLHTVLTALKAAEETIEAGRKPSLRMLQAKIRLKALFLTHELEELTQRRAPSSTKLVPAKFLDRKEHDPGPWAATAAFLLDYSSPQAWHSADVPALVARGLKALRAVLVA